MLEKLELRSPSWASRPFARILLAVGAIAIGGTFQAAAASTLCVSPSGTNGCHTTIQDAVNAASPGDTILVKVGVYREGVTIGIPLSLIGANASNTIIDATGQSTGINVDGLDNAGLANVTISGFTIENANFEAIVVTNASNVTLWGNTIVNNNLGLDASAATCNGIPDWETAEGFDCGEGIHLSGVDHSTVANNMIAHNAGGILLSDDTGATHDNLITGNTTANNPFDCGITLASHPPAEVTGATSPFGVYHNTISDNVSSGNGVAIEGAGAGVGIFGFLPGAGVYANVVVHNRLIGNGLPGVAMHSHAPGGNFRDNAIIGNYIAGNGADTEDAFTPGTTGINVFGVSAESGTVISQNIIKDEDIGIAVNTPALIQAHLNDLLVKGFGVDNLGSNPVDATQNWWGCSRGPGSTAGCSSTDGPGITTWPPLGQPFHGDK
ncbi:MAG: right-handed parallel beta-helix repeat-containing protein [Acidobacteriota bacterium]|nr:right-handed parallel beta-helix repeat-containing protein [Acidobacteriota bacterium]